jgi:hypothetical protein
MVMARFLIMLLVCAVVSCRLEESRLQISNPEALSPHLSILARATPKSAALVIFTGEKAELSVEDNNGVTQLLKGRIDMMGLKTWTKYPIRFNFRADSLIVSFVQNEASNQISIVDVRSSP